jgi:Magnesium chelatase, subunit ChlI C-terminal
VLRVARTLADLDDADEVGRVHLAEAMSYRANEIRRAACIPVRALFAAAPLTAIAEPLSIAAP